MPSDSNGREPSLGRSRSQRRISVQRLGPLLRLLPPDAVGYSTLVAAVRSDNPYLRFEGAMKLVQKQDRESREVIETLLRDPSPIIRASIARHLDQMSWFSAKKIVHIPLTDADLVVRESVVYALCRFREREAFALLAAHLQDEEDHVLAAAAHALRDAANPEAIAVLATAMRAKDPDVRVKALEAFSASGDANALPYVRDALDDPAPEVQYAATLTLIEIQGEAGVDEMLTLLEKQPSVVNEVLRGVFHATNYMNLDMRSGERGDRWLDVLRRAVREDDNHTKLSAAHALAWNRHPDAAREIMTAYTTNADAFLQARILHITVSLMSPAADEMLQRALENEQEYVREAAHYEVRVIERFGKRTYADGANGTGMLRPLKGF